MKAKLAGFLATHARHSKAEDKVAMATEALRAAQAVAGAIDGELDGNVIEIAALLPSIGLPRLNPFKPLGLAAPSTFVKLTWKEEAKAAKTLGTKAGAQKKATPQVKALAKQIIANGARLTAALKPVDVAEKNEAARSAHGT